MATWRFGEYPEDGEAWLRDPVQLFAYVDYKSEGSERRGEWRRLMVVTKAWLMRNLENVRHGESGPLWAAIPTMLVLPDATGEELRSILDAAMRQGGLDVYSSAAVTTSQPN